MKTENKQYKLKRWYPSLDSCWEVGDIALYYRNGVYWNGTRVVENGVSAREVENNPDFWELIEEEKLKPLFITDDDIEIFDDTTEIISVSIKHHTVSKWGYRYLCKPLDCENFKHFGIEANADKYIEENKPKPLFITEDGVGVFNRKEIILAVNIEKSTYTPFYAEDILTSFSDKDIEKMFHSKYNAIEYIWKNKLVFSYEDFIKWGNIPYPRAIEQLAKERSKR